MKLKGYFFLSGLAVKMTMILEVSPSQEAVEAAAEVGRGPTAVADPGLVPSPPKRETAAAAAVPTTRDGRRKSGLTTSSGRRRRCRSTSDRTPTGTGSATTGKRFGASGARNERGTGQSQGLQGQGAPPDHHRKLDDDELALL